jgi:thioesterase domain-containing protein
MYPHGPYCLVGFCRWAGIALEMAHQLKAEGEEVPAVVLIEYYPFGSRLSKTSTRYINLGVRRFYNDLNSHSSFLGKVEFLNNQLYTFRKFLYKKIKEKKQPVDVKFMAPPIKPYSGKVVLISARQRPFGFKDHLDINWSERFTGEFESYIVEGDHLGIFTRRGPKQMGEKLNEIMEEVNKMYKDSTANSRKALGV